MENPDSRVIVLPPIFCILVDLPETNLDCFNQTCFKCSMPGQSLTGDKLEGPLNSGRVICIIIWFLCLTIGIIGTFSNYLIIKVLRKNKDRGSFDFLLLVLASIDMINTAASAITTTAAIIFVENWNSGLVTLLFYYVPLMFTLFGRSASTFMTDLIMIERYMVMKFFMSSSQRFSMIRMKFMAIGIIGFAFLLNFPRFTSAVFEKVHEGNLEGLTNVSSLQRLDYVIRSTSLERFWYFTLRSAHYQIDMWLPFPLLITFNVLLYLQIKKFTARRQRLNIRQRTDIRAARMFTPVVIVLCLCNALSISAYIALYMKQIIYRELFLGLLLSIVVNSSVNLPIYYSRGSPIRKEIQAVLPFWMKTISGYKSDRLISQHNGTQSTISSDVNQIVLSN